MTDFFELKEKLRSIYGLYSAYLNPLFKFLLALAVFMNIDIMLGYLAFLNNIFVVLILALFCALLPMTAMVLIGCVLVFGHCWALGIEVAVFALVLLLILVLLFLRFTPSDSLALLLAPLAFQLHIPCVIPIGLGLLGGPASCFSAACSVMFYYFIKLVQDKAVLLQNEESGEVLQRLTTLLEGMIQNPMLWLNVIAFAAITLTVYCIRRASADHAWTIAIVTGGLLYPILTAFGGYYLDLEISILVLMAGSAAAIALMLLLELFIFSVDYSRSEFLQYEDDNYYYYVKAVPKIRVVEQQRSVKTIGSETEPADDRKSEKKATAVPEKRAAEKKSTAKPAAAKGEETAEKPVSMSLENRKATTKPATAVGAGYVPEGGAVETDDIVITGSRMEDVTGLEEKLEESLNEMNIRS